jgi:hypothetical protein
MESLESNGFLYDPVWDRLSNCKDATALVKKLMEDLRKT